MYFLCKLREYLKYLKYLKILIDELNKKQWYR